MSVWRPSGGAFEGLLNREQAIQNSREGLGGHVERLDDLVDYGTQLIRRCWRVSNHDLRAGVVLHVLLKHVIEMVDCASVMIAAGCIRPSLLAARSAFESSVNIDWILQRKSEWRARSYYAWSVLERRRTVLMLIKGSPMTRATEEEFQSVKRAVPMQDDVSQDKLRYELGNIDAHLALPFVRPVAQRLARLKSKRGIPWASVFYGRDRSMNVYKISRIVGRLGEYRLAYTYASEVTHGSRFDHQVEAREGQTVVLRPIREMPGDTGLIIKLVAGQAIRSYQAVIDEWRSGERGDFSQHYLRTWRPLVMDRIVVKPDSRTVDL